jgi:CheY-like chemotaxis protein
LREARTGKVRATAAKTLRVLVVEDSENNVMLLHRELRRGGYEPLHERVHIPEGMEEAWRAAEAGGEPFQVVDPGVPFIVVSGKVGGRMLRWRS